MRTRAYAIEEGDRGGRVCAESFMRVWGKGIASCEEREVMVLVPGSFVK